MQLHIMAMKIERDRRRRRKRRRGRRGRRGRNKGRRRKIKEETGLDLMGRGLENNSRNKYYIISEDNAY